MTRYLLDTNAFVEAHRVHYGFSFCPGFWDWIDQSHGAGKIFSVEAVLKELASHKDALSKWARKRAVMFLGIDDHVVSKMKEVSAWAMSNYKENAVDEFLTCADSYLVAHAAVLNFVVITHEQRAGAGASRIKIPNACDAFGVKCMRTHEVLKAESALFVLKGLAKSESTEQKGMFGE